MPEHQQAGFKIKCLNCRGKLIISINQAKTEEKIKCIRCNFEIESREAIANILISGINKKDANAMECFIQIFDREIRKVISRILTSRLLGGSAEQEREDTVYEVYYSVWSHGVEPIQKNLTSYVRGMAYHKAIDLIRGRKNCVYLSFEEKRHREILTISEEDRRILIMDFKKALALLSGENQEVFELHHIKGLPLKEVAKHLSIKIGAVKSRLHRAVAEIEDFLKERGYQ